MALMLSYCVILIQSVQYMNINHLKYEMDTGTNVPIHDNVLDLNVALINLPL